MFRKSAVILLAFVCLLAAPSPGWAAYMELSATAKKALDATAKRAGPSTTSRIGALYGDFLSSQKETQDLDKRIKTLRASNVNAESALRKEIRDIDASKLRQLELQLKQTKARYQPLFNRYTALNKQIAAARSLKNKDLNAVLNMQAKVMQAAVQLARQDIRVKDGALKAAKAERNRKMKVLRGSLDEITPLKAKMKTLNQTAAADNKRISLTWKSLNEQARRDDASGAAASLSSLLTLSRQITGYKQEIHRLESRIAETILTVKQRYASTAK